MEAHRMDSPNGFLCALAHMVIKGVPGEHAPAASRLAVCSTRSKASRLAIGSTRSKAMGLAVDITISYCQNA